MPKSRPTRSRTRPRAARTRTAALVVGLAALLAASACSGPAAPPGPGPKSAASTRDSGAAVPAPAALHWHACSGQLVGLGVPRCATLSVPVNYADPGGRHITLALDMVPATAPRGQRQGILLVNPGGPGVSGLSLAADVAKGLDRQVAAQYDVVGFDPRGVGSSVPALSCDKSFLDGPRPDLVPASAAAEQALVSGARTYARDCEQKFGWLLPYMTTKDSARDMDSIRAAFGVSKLNYYGFSYGTYLGQVYATMFPERVRRMVLDSIVDPTGVWYADNLAQDYAFQGRLDAFFAWVARYDGTYHLGGTAAQVRAAWYRARGQVRAQPVAGIVGPDEFDDTFLLGAYLDALWPGLAQALSSYLNSGQVTDLVAEYQAAGTQNENEAEFAVYNAVQCSDVSWPRDWARWDADARKVYRTAPFQAWDNTWFNAACAFWPLQGPARPPQIKGAGLPGILMLQGTLDPATPYAGGQQAHKLLPSARMVVVKGDGNHGQSMQTPPNPCVQRYLNSYLATGALPASPGLVNATCPATPLPTPGS